MNKSLGFGWDNEMNNGEQISQELKNNCIKLIRTKFVYMILIFRLIIDPFH